jgi:hypothetical protein
LDILAKDNFLRHDGQEIILNGAKVADIMPFGISNVRPAGGVAAPQPQPQDGAGLDEDFGVIREGGRAVGGILGDLNPRRFGGDYADELLAVEDSGAFNLDELLGGAGEFKESEDPAAEIDALLDEAQRDFEVRRGEAGAEIDELIAGSAIAQGRQINYMNVRRFGTRSFGFQRREVCYDQLRRMEDLFATRVGVYSGYQLSATFSTKKDGVFYGQSAAVDFGTTQQDGETRRVPFDHTKWDFDIHNRLHGMQLDGFETKESQYFRLDSPFNAREVIENLIRSMEAAMPVESDSGGGNFDNTRLHLMNIFLFKFSRIRAGGPGQYDISSKLDERPCFSQKSVFTPERDGDNMCFWECLVYFLYSRYTGCGIGEAKWYENILKAMKARLSTVKQKSPKLRRLCKKYAPTLMERYATAKDRITADIAPLDLEEIDAVLQFYDCRNACLIMDSDGEALVGDLQGAEYRIMAGDMFTGIWFDDHMHLVISYTGSLIVKKCRRCDKRFSKESVLKQHLLSKKCMTCVCLQKGKFFDDESEWSLHMANREERCPRYRLSCIDESVRSESSTVDEKGRKLRFLQDKKRPSAFSRRKELRDALEHDNSPIRNHQEAIYFDLESVVPMNSSGLSNDEHLHQIPYACGWTLRSEAERGDDVRITYGTDCIAEFVEWLDELYEEYLKDEVQLWVRRAELALITESIPKKVEGIDNYAMRLIKSWDLHVAKSDSVSCLFCGEIMESVHGYEKGGDGKYTFSRCCMNEWSQNVAANNIVRNFNSNAPRVSVWAHNGGKYDWVFLHRYLLESGKLDHLSTVRSNSKYYELTYKNIFQFKDSMNFVMGSLDTLGKNFGVETLKGIFPYRLLSSVDRVNWVLKGEEEIRENIPHVFFQISEKLPGPMGVSIKRTMREDEYVEFFAQREWEYDIKAETITYLKDDVKCLYQVVEKFRKGWHDMPHSPELFKFCTIGQMCHTYFLKNYLQPEMYPCLDVCEDAFIRRALYGGRTEVFRRVAPEGSRIHYVDVNSLYPYVMESRDLPCGDPIWHFRRNDPQIFEFVTCASQILTRVWAEEDFDRVMRELNEGANDKELYGFFEVDVQCNINVRYPVLPERLSTDGDVTFKNMFTNMSKKKMVYYSEELKKAIKCGCRVTKVHAFCKWNRGRVYESLITVLKKQKLLGEGKDVTGRPIVGVAKNPSLRAAAKTAQNSLFGKTIQFIDSSVQLVHTREKLYSALNNAFSKVSIKPIFRSAVSDVVEVNTKCMPRVQQRSCSAIGTAILAEARLVLYEYFEIVQEIGGEILYCDTDSIVFAGDNPLPDYCMDDCAYGKMKVEIDPDTIELGGFVGMSPKCYSFNLKNGDPYVRCKGVNLSQNLDVVPEERDGITDLLLEMENEEYINSLALPIGEDETTTRGINFEKMKDLILGNVDAIVTKQMQFLKTTDRRVSAYENVKVMRSRFDKRFLGDYGETFAWNDFNMNMDTIVERCDNRALSDYLDWVGPAELHVLRKKYQNNTFFEEVVNSWFDSSSANVLVYDYYRNNLEQGYVMLP